jgi:hypothetical protein
VNSQHVLDRVDRLFEGVSKNILYNLGLFPIVFLVLKGMEGQEEGRIEGVALEILELFH